MERTFQTMANRLHRSGDCRVMYLEIEFSDVSRDALAEAGKQYYLGLQSFHNGQFVERWDVDGSFPRESKILQEIEQCRNLFSMIVLANVRTASMRWKKDLTAFKRQMMFDLSLPENPRCSLDYMQYFSHHIQSASGRPDVLKQRILQLFSEPGKYNIGWYHFYDADGFFSASIDPASELYNGTISYKIAKGCVADHLKSSSEQLCELLCRLCECLGNANGRVGLCPFPTPGRFNNSYMKYFGWDYWQDSLHGENSEEPMGTASWRSLRHEYLCGYDWANVISPAVYTKLLCAMLSDSDNSIVQVRKLNGGAVFLRLNQRVERSDVAAMAYLKRMLYPALYPGGSIFSVNLMKANNTAGFLPRCRWELCPIDEEEIETTNGAVVFRHLRRIAEG